LAETAAAETGADHHDVVSHATVVAQNPPCGDAATARLWCRIGHVVVTTLPGGLRVWRGWWLARQVTGTGRPSVGGPVPVNAVHHAALAALVTETAKRAGLDPPGAVTLGGTARVEMRGHLLSIGLPLVWGLSGEELGAVVAHELALPATRFPKLTRRLLEVPAGETSALVEAVEQVRDAAAIDALGGGLAAVEDAARALLRAESVNEAFRFFCGTVGRPLIDGRPVQIADLHEGWREHLRELGAPGNGWSPEVPLTRIPAAHPGLATELADLARADDGQGNGLDPAAVPIDELTAAQQQALAAAALGADCERWMRFGELPVTVYRGRVESTARRHVEAVESLLGGPPADRDELVDVLLRRAGEVARAQGVPADPDPLAGASMVADVIEYTLMRKGWKRRHPVVPWRMIGPGGASVDLDAARTEPARLRRLLNDPAAAA
jgi:hypothetical protein